MLASIALCAWAAHDESRVTGAVVAEFAAGDAPTDVAGAYSLGRVLLAAGSEHLAAEALSAVAVLDDPYAPYAYAKLVVVAEARGDLLLLPPREPLPRVDASLVAAALRADDLAERKALADAVDRESAFYPYGQLAVAEAFVAVGDLYAAEGRYLEALAAGDEALVGLGRVQARLGRCRDARAALRRVGEDSVWSGAARAAEAECGRRVAVDPERLDPEVRRLTGRLDAIRHDRAALGAWLDRWPGLVQRLDRDEAATLQALAGAAR